MRKTTGIKKMTAETSELEKSKSHIMVEILEYVPNSVLSRTIVHKLTGNIIVSSLDSGEGFNERDLSFRYVYPDYRWQSRNSDRW